MTRRSALEIALVSLAAPCARPAGKTYIVGSTATGVPFSFIDVKTNTLTGAMVDIVKAVAADAGRADRSARDRIRCLDSLADLEEDSTSYRRRC